MVMSQTFAIKFRGGLRCQRVPNTAGLNRVRKILADGASVQVYSDIKDAAELDRIRQFCTRFFEMELPIVHSLAEDVRLITPPHKPAKAGLAKRNERLGRPSAPAKKKPE